MSDFDYHKALAVLSHGANPGLLFFPYYFSPEADGIAPIATLKEALVGDLEKEQKTVVEDLTTDQLFTDGQDNETQRSIEVHYLARNGPLLAKLALPPKEKAGLLQDNYHLQHALDPSARDLTIRYPGLLVGLGYNHQVSHARAINAGFAFEHTTGLPYLPGSSVKGAIRSAFPGRDRDGSRKKKQDERYASLATAKEQWLQEWAQQQGVEPIDWDALEIFLFAESNAIFYDALLTKTNPEQRVFGSDSITPHISRREEGKSPSVPDIYVEPTPIGLLKVLPEVGFTFAFNLPPAEMIKELAAGLSAALLRDLFYAILANRGIGAKTRLGYGHFTVDGPKPLSAAQLAQGRAVFEDADFVALIPEPPREIKDGDRLELICQGKNPRETVYFFSLENYAEKLIAPCWLVERDCDGEIFKGDWIDATATWNADRDQWNLNDLKYIPPEGD